MMRPSEPIAPGIRRLRLGRVNSYLIEADGGVILVDGGLPSHAAPLRRLLAGRPLRALLLTHRHLDHAGSAAHLAAWSGARVVIHAADARAVLGEERLSPLRPGLDLLLGPLAALLDRRVFRFRPCPGVEAVTDGWELAGLRLLHLPGHTPGHSGYLHLASGTVFGGDAARVGPRGNLRAPSRLFTRCAGEARLSQLRLAELDAPLYCFGHGPPLRDGAAALRRLARAARRGK